jgi:hypothetical protein
MKTTLLKVSLVLGLALAVAFGLAPVQAKMIFEGDGSDEPGFVAPPEKPPKPPPPPANMSSAETYIPYPGPPATPQSRSEKKNPPTPPVMFIKITSQYGEVDWGARPNDLNNLLKTMKEMIDVNFSYETRSFAEIDPDPERNPILYRTGHFHFSLTLPERARLRQYLLNGGTIIFNTGMGSKPFYDSARKELAEMFPEVQVQRLSPDHPIFHAYYDLDRVGYRKGVRQYGYKSDEPWFEGVTINCRTVAVISRWGMEVGWDPVDDDSLLAYSVESAQKLGINLLSYATAQRAWAKQAAHAMEFVDQSKGTTAGKMSLAQIIYDGEWKTRHAGLSVLLQQFNGKTEIPVKFARQELRLSDTNIFNCPLLYMTGHEDFRLQAAELAGLRDYLNKGGLLFAEACCGREAFDAAFRLAMSKIFPDQTLKAIPLSSLIFSLPNRVAQLGVTPALAAQLGNRSTVEPKLLGIEKDGHYVVVYTPYGMAGGWELAQNPYAHGYEDSSAIALGENILMYAITQ